MRLMILTLALVAACGGSRKPEAAAAPENREEHGMEMDESALTPELKDFHDVLAPLWHSEKPTRGADTCAAIGQFVDRARAVKEAGAPAGAAADWDDRAQALADAVTEMGISCEGSGGEGTDFETDFQHVHERFHALMDALPKAS